VINEKISVKNIGLRHYDQVDRGHHSSMISGK